MWLSSGIPEVCCYAGLAKIWDEAVWLVHEGFAAFSYLGYQVESGMGYRWNYGYMGASKSMRYDAERLASRLLDVWLCGLISMNM